MDDGRRDDALEHIDEVECSLGRSHIVVCLVVLHFLATLLTFVLVVLGEYVTESNLCLQVPVLRQCPGISVGDASSEHPSLETVVFEFGEIGAEQHEVGVDVTDVVLTANGMEAEEVSHHLVAEPISCLRLYEPMFPFLVV